MRTLIRKSGWFPSQGEIFDLAGLPVNASGPIWHLNYAKQPLHLNWLKMPVSSPDVLEATVRYIARMIASGSSATAYNTFQALLDLHLSPSFVAADRDGG